MVDVPRSIFNVDDDVLAIRQKLEASLTKVDVLVENVNGLVTEFRALLARVQMPSEK